MIACRRYSAFLAVLVFCFVLDPAGALADSQFAQQPWTELETEHTIVRYKSDDDLLRFHSSVKYGPGRFNRTSAFSSIPMAEVQQMVIHKTDAIFERAQAILDMRKKFKKPFINIYPDDKELNRAYSIIYKSQCNVRAWYRYRDNTLYINVRDVHAGMLGHELAHGIIDHFLIVKPPSETAEILARYVDSHL